MLLDPHNLFGYERLGFDAGVSYGELSSAESGVDTSTTAKASGTGTKAPQRQPKASGGKSVPKVANSVRPGFLVAASSIVLKNHARLPHPGGYLVDLPRQRLRQL